MCSILLSHAWEISQAHTATNVSYGDESPNIRLPIFHIQFHQTISIEFPRKAPSTTVMAAHLEVLLRLQESQLNVFHGLVDPLAATFEDSGTSSAGT